MKPCRPKSQGLLLSKAWACPVAWKNNWIHESTASLLEQWRQSLWWAYSQISSPNKRFAPHLLLDSEKQSSEGRKVLREATLSPENRFWAVAQREILEEVWILHFDIFVLIQRCCSWVLILCVCVWLFFSPPPTLAKCKPSTPSKLHFYESILMTRKEGGKKTEKLLCFSLTEKSHQWRIYFFPILLKITCTKFVWPKQGIFPLNFSVWLLYRNSIFE